MKNSLIASLLLIAATLHAQSVTPTPSEQSLPAEEERVVTTNERHYAIGSGTVSLLDTYLSQETFSGTSLTLLYGSERQRSDRQWSTTFETQLNLSTAEDHAGNDSELEGHIALYGGRLRHWNLYGNRLHLEAGAQAMLGVGFLYNTRLSGNNPAQARLSLLVMPSAGGSYDFRLLRQRFSVRAQILLPLCGLTFSPRYGQSYYEIFAEGDYDHNVVPTTFVSQPTMRSSLSLCWQVSRTTSVSLGWLGDYRQSRVNNLKQHVNSSSLMLGLILKN